MGSGCSSPLRRFAGKRTKPSNRDSVSLENNDNLDRITIAAHLKKPRELNTDHTSSQHAELNLENEITIQSEAAEDHPSSASYYTDDRIQVEDGSSSKAAMGQHAYIRQLDEERCADLRGPNTATLGLTSDNQPFTSPALSPAISDCQSPALNNSLQATTSSMSLNSAQSAGTTQQKSLITTQTVAARAQQQQIKQKIFIIKDNHKHVVITHPDKSCITVWDIFLEKTVRTINNVDQPRDLRMIDNKRSVVLCNRELRVYDLDSGEMLTKLKGVMNQKMPYFEVYGQEYVIALARNRMYVNMLNLKTGELETTFKVGEDRFLNSLLVSANGGICVCGDETQKPFPLLVWNLNERRLMYDLRLDKHEFLTKMSAISDDGHFVVSVCKQLVSPVQDTTISVQTPSEPESSYRASFAANFIVIYDLTSGTLFKKWRPGLDTCAVAISLPSNRSGKVINSIVDNTILVWDLATGSQRHTLSGHSSPADVIIVQNNRLFSMDSTGRDRGLRLWDIEGGQCLGVFNPDEQVSCCQLSTRGDVIICGISADFKLATYILEDTEESSDKAKRNKRRKSSKTQYIFDEPQASRKSSS